MKNCAQISYEGTNRDVFSRCSTGSPKLTLSLVPSARDATAKKAAVFLYVLKVSSLQSTALRHVVHINI